MFLSTIWFSGSFLKARSNKPVGHKTKKNSKDIIKGATKAPSIMPKRNHILFGKANSCGRVTLNTEIVNAAKNGHNTKLPERLR